MRVGMFTDTWLPTRDGVVTSIMSFKGSLEKLGHEVFLFAPEDKTGQAPMDDRIYYFKAGTFGPYPDYRMAFPPTLRVKRLIVDNDIEILHNHGIAFMALKAMFSSRWLGLPILLHFHTWVTDATQYYPFPIGKDMLVKMSWRYLRSLCRRSDGVVGPSETAINELKEKVPGMRFTDFASPGIDFRRFDPNIKGDWVREKFDIGNSEVILHAGRVSKEKNLELIFEAFPMIRKEKPNARLLVVGSGPAMGHYKALAKQNKIQENVIFTGFVPDEELAAYYASADVLVLASPFETLGLVMIEALAMGKPIAGLRYRVIPEIVREGYNGYLFDFTPRDCAANVLKALDAPDEMKRNAIESVQHFDSTECTKKLVEIYKKVIEIKRARSA